MFHRHTSIGPPYAGKARIHSGHDSDRWASSLNVTNVLNQSSHFDHLLRFQVHQLEKVSNLLLAQPQKLHRVVTLLLLRGDRRLRLPWRHLFDGLRSVGLVEERRNVKSRGGLLARVAVSRKALSTRISGSGFAATGVDHLAAHGVSAAVIAVPMSHPL